MACYAAHLSGQLQFPCPPRHPSSVSARLHLTPESGQRACRRQDLGARLCVTYGPPFDHKSQFDFHKASSAEVQLIHPARTAIQHELHEFFGLAQALVNHFPVTPRGSSSGCRTARSKAGFFMAAGARIGVLFDRRINLIAQYQYRFLYLLLLKAAFCTMLIWLYAH